jgi:hypothetical protein
MECSTCKLRAVSRRFLITESQVQPQDGLCGVFGVQSGVRVRFPLPLFIPLTARFILSVIQAGYNGLLTAYARD